MKCPRLPSALAAAFLLLSCASTPPRDPGRLRFVTIDEELALGEETASFSVQNLNIIRNRDLQHALSETARRLGAVSHWQGLSYSIFVINEHDVNHFSLPGGNIYLFRGILELCSSTDELAAVTAHEIAHLSMRDGVARLAEKYGYSLAAQKVLGENPEIAEHIIRSLYTDDTILDYGREAEFAADRLAADYLIQAGFSPAGMVTLLKKIAALEKQRSPRIALLRHTHPPAAARLKRLRRVTSLHPTAPSDGTDSLFIAVQSVLSRLPQ